MHRSPLLAAAWLAVLLAVPLATVAQPAQRPQEVVATYATYARLLNVLNLEATLALRPDGYGLRVVTHTAGTVRVFLRSDIDTSVSGTFGPGFVPRPVRYASHGTMGGEPRDTLIDYPGGDPVVRTLVPPAADDDRDDVPAADTLHTVDTLSAMAMLMRQASETGRCEGSLTTFDGRRLAVLTAHTTGPDTLEQTRRSSYAGPALRCDFEGRQTGGFKHDADPGRERRPQHGTAWFARPVDGGPLLPVRVDFENRILGVATMYITSAALR